MKTRSKNGNGVAKPSVVRCAVYTRKSTDEGLDSGFNSLDAQRESSEAYIASQRNEGWVCLPDRYDDPGFSGGTMDRPGLRRLLADLEARKVDCIVVYKVDRLSRSLLDFSRIIATLDDKNASFVSVTQQFNTSTSMGRLTLNVLLSFANFERELVSERTADKMGAARRRGKWIGGYPLLGYDIAEKGGRLLVNEAEAKRVREIFQLYLERESLLETVRELNRRGWKTKSWTTRRGVGRGGNQWAKNLLHAFLSNPTYVGKVHFQGTTYDGEHSAIVDAETWNKVQRLLKRNAKAGGQITRNKYNAILAGLLRCVPCDAGMTHTYTLKKTRRIRYYVCTKAQRFGRSTCPTGALPAGEVEKFVVDRIRTIGTDDELRAQVLVQVGEGVDREDLARHLTEFDPIWDTLTPRERSRVIQLLIERVAYDAARETIAVTFRPNLIPTLTEDPLPNDNDAAVTQLERVH